MARRGAYSRGIAKREEILDTALAVIAERGFHRASVKELAAAAGLSQAGLMHHFGSKDELFAEILRRRDDIDLAATEHAGGMLYALRAVIAHNLEVAGLVQLYAALSTEAALNPEHHARTFFQQRYAMLIPLLADAIYTEQAEGIMRPEIDPQALASIIMAAADGMQTQWLLADRNYDMVLHLDILVNLARFPDKQSPI